MGYGKNNIIVLPINAKMSIHPA